MSPAVPLSLFTLSRVWLRGRGRPAPDRPDILQSKKVERIILERLALTTWCQSPGISSHRHSGQPSPSELWVRDAGNIQTETLDKEVVLG